MSTASVTSKGQVTIPSKIRHLLSIKPGDRLLFESEGQEVRIRVVPRRQASDFLGAFKTSEPFPGTQTVRESTAKSLASRHKSPRP
jgi:AbrB family looped-hinge helix DNA binding protein